MPEGPAVLVVEDDPEQREALVSFLEDAGYEVRGAEGVQAARETVRSWVPDLIVSDYQLEDGTGLEVLDLADEIVPAPARLLVTAYGTVSLAVEAMRKGAVDVQLKPVDPEVLLATIRRGLETRELSAENVRLKAQLGETDVLPGVVAESVGMQRVVDQVRRVAPSRAAVLITGESGTGKEMIARLLHARSACAAKPFIAVNCGALSEGLLESELFGHVTGAFTGAGRDRRGRFEEADGGSVFLDEVCEMPPPMQVRLLRVLQERQVVRVGENAPRTVDFRLIAATNRDPEADVRAGRFREDLYYRLNVVRIHVPPLCERPQDIAPLVHHFAARIARRDDLKLKPFSQEALEMLEAYEFPGNVRQLQNVVEGALLVATGPAVRPADLTLRSPAEVDVAPEGATDLSSAMDAYERRRIAEALLDADGVTARAAEALGIPARTLRHKMQKHGLRGSRGTRGK